VYKKHKILGKLGFKGVTQIIKINKIAEGSRDFWEKAEKRVISNANICIECSIEGRDRYGYN
jgi:hypothetical protein